MFFFSQSTQTCPGPEEGMNKEHKANGVFRGSIQLVILKQSLAHYSYTCLARKQSLHPHGNKHLVAVEHLR